MIIEFDDNKYSVIKEKKLSEYHGCYRSIQYDTGYYALQSKEDIDDVWKTIFICPVLDFNISTGSDLSIPFGELYMDNLLLSLEESDKLYNGEYWTLNLNLSDDTNFMEVITKGDGETLLEQLIELMSLEEEQFLIYNQVSPIFNKLRLIFYTVGIICLLCIICKIIGII